MFKRIGCLIIFSVCSLVILALTGLAAPYLFLALGDRALAAADYVEAEQQYGRAQALALLPGVEPQALWGSGQAHLKQRHWADAIADFTQVLAAQPAQSEVYGARGFAYLKLGQFQNAIDDLSVYLDAVPGQPDPLAQRGFAYLQLDLLDEAIADLQAAVDLQTSDRDADKTSLAEAYFRRATQAAARSAFTDVVSDLSKAIYVDAYREDIFTLRAFANLQLGRFDETIADASASIRLEPGAAAAYAYRAAARIERKDWQLAGADATRALNSAGLPKREQALALYARALSAAVQEKYESVIADSTSAVALGSLDRSRSLTLYLVRASAHTERDEYSDAISDYDAALSLQPSDLLKATIYSGRGWSHLLRDEDTAAAADFSAALDVSPDDPWLYQHRGLAYASLRDYTRALADDDRALALDPRRPVALTNRGSVYAALKQFDKAIADYEKALSLSDDPEDSNRIRSYILLSEAAIHSQQADQAAKEFSALADLGSARGADAAQRFQQNFAASRQKLQTLQAELDQMAQQYAQIEKLDLPEWYRGYAAKNRQSLEREREGFGLIEQLWNKTNTLVTNLPKLTEQLDQADSSSSFNREMMDRYNRLVGNRDFAGARALTAATRAELKQYQEYFQRAQRESGLDFVADAVQYFGKQVEYMNALDELTAAVEAYDQIRFDQTLAKFEALDADLKRLGGRMANWDSELKRWWQKNVQPLADAADAKFKEADQLGKDAAKLFDESRQKVIIRQHRNTLPPGVKL